MRTVQRRGFLALSAASVASPFLVPGTARASGTPMNIGVSVSSEYAALFAAKEQGFFAANGIDASLTIMTNLPALTAGVMSGSFSAGTIGSSHAILSYAAGLPLAAIGPCGVTPSTQRIGIVARSGAGIATLKDLEGKRVGVPALRNNLDIGAANLVAEAGGDFRKVNFVEIPLPQVPDLLASKQIDAAVCADPVFGRAVAAGAADIGQIYRNAPPGTPSTLVACSRAWAEKNGPTIRAFRAAITSGIQYVKGNPDAAANLVSQSYKMDKELVRQLGMPSFSPTFDMAGLEWWVKVMQKQGLLTKNPELGRFVLA